MRRVRRLWFLVGALAAGLLAACSGSPATPTLAPVVVAVYQTGSPAPTTATTASPAPIPATPTLAPGAPSPTAVPVYGPDTYPAGINPLTGQAVDPTRLNRIPIAVKISNFPYGVRPQSGLALADVVFEHLAEAGLTRFTALFLQSGAAKVGSIRSARYIDTEVVPMFGAMLVTSGSSLGTMHHLRSNPWFAGENVWRLVSEESSYVCPPLCRETPDDANTLFASTEALYAATAAQAGATQAGQSGFVFTPAIPAGGAPANEILLDYSSAAHVAWRYNATAATYTRWQEKDASGEMAAHIDALTGQPITAVNVVVLFVNHQNNFVPEDFRDGGNCGMEIQLWTIGPAKIFRDGQLYEGRWHRDASTNWRLRLEDANGQNIPLRPGNTWFGVVGLTADAALNGSTYTVTNKVLDTKRDCPVPPTETPTLTPEGYVDPNVTPGPEATTTPAP
jgi:hypothetical protein